MQEFELLSISHFLGFCICLAAIIFIPKAIQAKPGLENFSKYFLVFLLVENQIRSTYVETLIKGGNLLENLPLHLCDFSAIVIAVFLLTGFRPLFIFAYFWGIAGAGMSILTPDSEFAFPHYEYFATMYGHSLILLAVVFSITNLGQRPYLRDIPKLIFYSSILLVIMYGLNYILGANYWYLNERPYGDNILSLMPEPPVHMFILYPVAIFFIYLVYSPYIYFDRRKIGG
jgi:hypothetical integral membrane protein (TIGR02206 family)